MLVVQPSVHRQSVFSSLIMKQTGNQSSASPLKLPFYQDFFLIHSKISFKVDLNYFAEIYQSCRRPVNHRTVQYCKNPVDFLSSCKAYLVQIVDIYKVDVWILEQVISILMISTRPDQGSAQCLNRADKRSLITTSGYQFGHGLVNSISRGRVVASVWFRPGKIY